MKLSFKNRSIAFPRRPLIMGIINVNDDSFCDDGSLEIADISQQVIQQIGAGADVIDVGAESARTNREAISLEEEIGRFSQFLRRWDEIVSRSHPRDEVQVWPPVLSLNTWRSEVIEAVLPLGGDILNDMSGLPDSRNAELAASHDVVLLIMHSVGEPKVPHTHVVWEDVVGELGCFFTEKVEMAKAAGLQESSIILDPGIDFAKQKLDNLSVYKRISEFSGGHVVLLPVSRKTVIGEVLGIELPTERDAGTVACIVQGMSEGVQCFRVHNVQAAYDTIKVVHSIV